MLKKYILFFLLIFFSISCSVNGNFKGLYSYYDKTKSESPNLLAYPDIHTTICELKNNTTPKIYITNGKELKKCLINYENLILFIWSPKCKSKYCYSLNLLQQNCNRNKIELIIVSEYYDTELMQIKYELKNPILGIDTNYYKSNKTSNYVSKFIFDLTSIEHIDGRLLHFKNGEFVKATDLLNN